MYLIYIKYMFKLGLKWCFFKWIEATVPALTCHKLFQNLLIVMLDTD